MTDDTERAPSLGPDAVQMGTLEIAATENESSLNVASVLEQSLGQQGHGGNETTLLSGLETHQSQLVADEFRDLIRVRSRSGAAAVYIRGNVVNLHRFLIDNERLCGCSLIGGNNHSVLVHQSDDGRSRLHKRGSHFKSLLKQLIP